MKEWIGVDPSPSAIRWQGREAGNDRIRGDVVYRLCGCPKNEEYFSADSWGDPLASKAHCFESFDDNGEIDKTGNYKFVQPGSAEWMRGYFAGGSCAAPTVDPQSTLTLAVPNTTDVRIQDTYLASLPGGYRKTYLLWRPVAIVLHWLDQMDEAARANYEGKRVFVLDLDGGYPELSELRIKRHNEKRDWIVPARRPPRRVEELIEGAFDEELLDATFGSMPEYRQLMTGICAARMQELLESRETTGNVWIRRKGAWLNKKIRIPTELSRDAWKKLNPLFGGVKLNAEDVLILNGWAARRFSRQFSEVFSRFGCELEIAEANAVCAGACLFSQRIDLGLPTYYDAIPDYRYFDSIKMDWVRLFNSGEDVEPGTQLKSASFDNLVMKKNYDEVSLYVQNADERTPVRYARKLKVTLARLASEDIPLSMRASVQIARGSADLHFEMRDERQTPIFIVDKQPSRSIDFKYSTDRGGVISGEWEPEHRGYPEPQPVLGRIYDSEHNARMVESWLKDEFSATTQRLVSEYRSANGFSGNDKLITSRVGYHAKPPQPTRGLLGSRRLPNMPRIDQLSAAVAAKCHEIDPDYEKWENYCHTFATDEYKNSVRAKLAKAHITQTSWNFCYAPGYVLGDQDKDVELLLNYIVNQSADSQLTPKLWWSVFRMLCWHPESKLTNVTLIEEALRKLVDEDVFTAVANPKFSGNNKKFFSLAILYMLRAREGGWELPDDIRSGLLKLFRTGVLSDAPTPQSMLGSYQIEGGLSQYVIRFIEGMETMQDRELGAKLGGE